MESNNCSRSRNDQPFSYEAFSSRWRTIYEPALTYDQEQWAIEQTYRYLGTIGIQQNAGTEPEAVHPDDQEHPSTEDN